jgi:hypothetical protein
MRFDVQASLEAGAERLTCWIEQLPGVVTGAQITLTDAGSNVEQLWTITKIGTPRQIVDRIGAQFIGEYSPNGSVELIGDLARRRPAAFKE